MGIASFFRGSDRRDKKDESTKLRYNSDSDEDDEQWVEAAKYILNPLFEPEPWQATGLGSAQHRKGSLHRYPTPPGSASPTCRSFDLDRLSTSFPSPRAASSTSPADTPVPPSCSPLHPSDSRSSSPNKYYTRRPNPLKERFPGDMSHRPLDMLKRDAVAADQPFRRRKGVCETDMIDMLDTVGGHYHHGGPYDATLMSRNLHKKHSPVAAVERSNLEALRATPRENIIDSLTKHVPLQGTSTIPPGARDMSGRTMRYEEGADLMREADAAGGAYKRWDSGVQYHPDDLKGKGEPSFSIERDLAKNKGRSRNMSDPPAFELRPVGRHGRHGASRLRSNSQVGQGSSSNDARRDGDDTAGNPADAGLRRRFGTARQKNELAAEASH